MNPLLIGRYFMQKPPLLIWLAGASMKIFGISAFALRLPVLLAACAATTILFAWWQSEKSFWPACVAVFLLLSNPLWHTLARLCYTDILLQAGVLAAVVAVARDPKLERKRTVALAGAAIAFGIMVKNVAGVLPLPILVIFYFLNGWRLPWAALLKICVLALLLAAPWHIYQIIQHPRWLFADYVQVQLFEFGRNPPSQSSSEGAAWFYLKRLALTDPILCLLSTLALPFLLRSVREKKANSVLLLSWLVVMAIAPLLFKYRNLPYVLGVIPPLCLLATGFGPLTSWNKKMIAAAAVALFCCKAGFSRQPWGLPYHEIAPIPAERSLEWYAGLRRSNELIVVNSDDEFYSMALPLAKVRYCFIDAAGVTLRYAPHYAFLGITVTASQFEQLERWRPQFRRRLHEWGLDATDPIATSIIAASAPEVIQLIESHPSSDFYIPANVLAGIGSGTVTTHRVLAISSDRFFLLAAGASTPLRGPSDGSQPYWAW
ncbi:MAG: glycosyltransferase family 39 protein [Bryobacterales bacterium]|nr:glycosyltransferase family 39 protein [Bryobacterales bacterium]